MSRSSSPDDSELEVSLELLRDLEQQLEKAERRVETLSNENTDFVSKVSDLETQVSEARSELEQVRVAYLNTNSSVDSLELEAVYGSISWRITRPLRVTIAWLHSLVGIPKRSILGLYLSIPPHYRGRLKSGFFVRFPRLFKSTRSYKEWVFRHKILISGREVPVEPEPLVSILIFVEGNIDYVYRCLISIWEASPDVSYEIIFVHDGESDEVSVALAEMLTIEVIRRVVPALPKAISSSRGKFIHFLQNDVEVTKGWLDALVASYEDYPNAGIVGSMLLRTDGRFKQGQAGEVLVPDATELGSGSIDDPDRPEYNYARIIDGCSPESILIDKEAFGWAHAFEGKVDCTYLDAISLISEINRVKRDSIFQPWSKVVHHGEIAMNQRRAHACIDTAGVGKSDLKNSRILVIDAVTPTPDRDAGSVTSFYYMQLFIELGYDVTFIPADNFLRMEKYTENLQRIGVHCLYYPYWTSVESFLDQKGTDFDFVLLYRVEFAATYVDLVREKCPSAKIIFDTVDLHFLREMRQAEHENSRQLKMTAQQTREREIGVMLKADETIVLSEIEKNLLDDEDSLKDSTITTIPLILDIPGRNNPFSKRKDILFIGGYGHPPNVDAVLYFANSIWPLIHQSHPDIKFYVLGSNPPTEVKALNHDGIEIVGFVEELSDYFDSIRLSVVPLRYGAGIKGKIGSSLSYGVPVVSTAVGVEGMGIGEEGVLIAENEQTFSAALVKLYFDEDYWTKMSNLGLDFVDKNYSLAAGKKRLGQMLSRLKSGEEC